MYVRAYQDSTGCKTVRRSHGVLSRSKMYRPNSNAKYCCGTKHWVTVPLVHQLYRFHEAKTFDSISREVLWRILYHCRLPVKIVTIIRAFYKGFYVQVIHNGQKTEPLNIRTSIRQGRLLYPLQFLVTLGWVTKTAFAKRHGIQWSFRVTLILQMIWPYCQTECRTWEIRHARP